MLSGVTTVEFPFSGDLASFDTGMIAGFMKLFLDRSIAISSNMTNALAVMCQL